MTVKVVIIESEKDWGQRVDEVLEFENRVKAEEFVNSYNSKNNLQQVPDWYMYATIDE